MKKVLMIFCICIFLEKSYGMAEISCIYGNFRAFDAADFKNQLVYQMVRRSVVKVAVSDAAGSGIIWEINDDNIIIVSNRHLLMKNVAAEVTFCSSETINARIMGYSQQYDVGFLYIATADIPQKLLKEIYETVPLQYNVERDEDRASFIAEHAGDEVLQIGADLENGDMPFFMGTIKGISFLPLFNTQVLETACYAKAGMSGGGVFDSFGRFLGMISGGEVPEDAEKKESEITYSLPAWLVENEYRIVLSDFKGD